MHKLSFVEMRAAGVYAGLVIVVSSAGLVLGCGPHPTACTPPHCPFTADQAMALPDSQIYYPGSAVVSRSGTDGSNNVNGEPVDAYVTTVLNALATENEITSWYRKTLLAAGWKQIEAYSDASGHSFNAFTVSPPRSQARELIYLDFRNFQPPDPARPTN